MYDTDTILAAKEPKENDPETGETHPYNRLRVIGPSPVSHRDTGDWSGSSAQGVVVEPVANFGANWDKPFGWLQEHYTVESVPEPPMPVENVYGIPKVTKVIDGHSRRAGLTPEEVFAEQAPPQPDTVPPHRRAKVKRDAA